MLRTLSDYNFVFGVLAMSDSRRLPEVPIIDGLHQRHAYRGEDTALFVLPIGTGQETGPVAAWATTSGCARGAEQIPGPPLDEVKGWFFRSPGPTYGRGRP
ncbi:hypothetical protein BH23GEM6_BH23GEM6_24220 [soil metagenome]